MIDVLKKMMGSVLNSYNNTHQDETIVEKKAEEPVMGYTPNKSGLLITPNALVGAAIGAYLGNANAKKKMQEQLSRENAKTKKIKPVIEGDYYKQTNHIIQNLGVAFTPFGVVYTLNNKNNNVAIETIEVQEMNQGMRSAWDNKDGNYFKNIMLAKMFSDVQLAEQSFAKRLIDNYRKKANDIQEDTFFLMEKTANFEEASEEEIDMEILSLENIEFDLTLQRPFEKYAGAINNISRTLGFGELSKSPNKFKKDLENPKYLANNVKVAFLPDRVLFVVDDTLVSTISVLNMNELEYDAFQKNSEKYFKNLFKNKINDEKVSSIEFEEKEFLEKVASVTLEADMFLKSGIHPVIYFLELNKKYGLDWITYDPEALIKMITADYNLPVEIDDSALNKILCIQIANNNRITYENPHVFEKAVRAFNDKPIDFMQAENSDLNVDDFAFAIDILDRVTPYDDIYDNFNGEVLGYIATSLTKVNSKVYLPSYILGSPMEPQFTEALNEVLLKVCNTENTRNTDNPIIIDSIKDKNSRIHYISITCIKAIRHAMSELGEDANIHVLTDDVCIKMNVDEDILIMVREQILKNLALDRVLALRERALLKQLQDYNISEPGGIN